MAKKLYEEASVQDIAAAIREKTGGAETYKIAQMGDAVRGLTIGDQISHADIPRYVKAEALAVAEIIHTVSVAMGSNGTNTVLALHGTRLISR